MIDTYATARAMLADLAAKRVSARELLGAHVARNAALHGKLNAVIASDMEHAEAAAKSIDDARSHGAVLGALAGLPMTIKDGYDVYGLPAASGNPAWAERAKNCLDADLVARARRQGAIVWGKTNVPFMLGDFQSYNAIYGTTGNPFDLALTPGGSSGGAAAALASGITPLEIGSDIGGSLRHPANFCGVCSLKPSWGVLPMRGHIPPPPGIDSPPDLGVGGPMARNIGDLKLLWDVLNDRPHTPIGAAGRVRIAVWHTQAGWPLAHAVRDAVERAARACAEAGFAVEHIAPRLDAEAMLQTYLDLLIPIVSQGFPEALIAHMTATHDADAAAVRAGRDVTGEARYRLRVTQSDAEILAAQRLRAEQKVQLEAFFAEGYDAVLMPVTPVTAFAHDHSDPINARTLDVDGTNYPYLTALNWIALATSLHGPALTLPAARANGLPIGVQLVGPSHREERLFELALVLEEAIGPFPPPPL